MIVWRAAICVAVINAGVACSNPSTNQALPVTRGMYGDLYLGFEHLQYIYLQIREEKRTYTRKQLDALLGDPDWVEQYTRETQACWTFLKNNGFSSRSLVVYFDQSGSSTVAYMVWSYR